MSASKTSSLAIAVGILCLITATTGATEGVSPGAVDRMALVDTACPTFSWGLAADAVAFELVAHLLPEDGSQSVELGADSEALYARVTGSAASWTPSVERCLAPGSSYVWFVRAVYEMADDEVVTAGEWSAGRYFTVPAEPTPDELRRALDVLRRWESGGAVPGTVAGATARPSRASSGAATAGSASRLKSVPSASAAIRGSHPDVSGEVYGVVGATASAAGAGLGAANTAGGPDLVLDGSANGEVDTLLSESGLDRVSTDTEVFVVRNSGGGPMVLEVEGTLEATALDCPGCVSATQLAGSAVTSSKIATGAVSGTKILDGTVATADLADDSVTGSKIADGAVDSGAIRSNAVTSSHIADGTLTASDVDLNGGLYVSKTQLYEREESQTWNFANSLAQVTATCDDANDLPLAGWCEATISQGCDTHDFRADRWGELTYPAEFTCNTYNMLGNNCTVWAKILCISVP